MSSDQHHELAEKFRRLGAPDPDEWASSQLGEGFSQLHRFLFLRQAWAKILKEGDTAWIDFKVESDMREAGEPYSGIGQAAKRCLDKGVDPHDLTEVVRGMQAELLFDLCYMLDDPAFEEKEIQDLGWCLVEADKNGDPTNKPIEPLHESVLETDPTGREMRPRGVPLFKSDGDGAA